MSIDRARSQAVVYFFLFFRHLHLPAAPQGGAWTAGCGARSTWNSCSRAEPAVSFRNFSVICAVTLLPVFRMHSAAILFPQYNGASQFRGSRGVPRRNRKQ
jgi:hypothetical protein